MRDSQLAFYGVISFILITFGNASAAKKADDLINEWDIMDLRKNNGGYQDKTL